MLGVKEEPGHTVGEALVRYVGDKRLLLVLDNCEHLLHACADLAHLLLRAGGDLRILAASREPLRITGETAFPCRRSRYRMSTSRRRSARGLRGDGDCSSTARWRRVRSLP